MGSMGGGGGGGAGGDAGAEAEVEEVTEKTHFDIELTSFEKKSKIKVIKEVRSLLGLGLRQAKEMVESAPCWMQKEVKKEDAEGIVKKLEGLGAQCKLV